MRRLILMVLLVLLAATTSPVLAQDSRPSDVTADFNNDGFADLAVGVPGENDFAGAVSVLYGTAAGLTGTGAQLFGQVGGAPEFHDEFGSVLAAGDFNHDSFADLAVGTPLEDVGRIGDAGAVSVLYGSPQGLISSGGQLFTQVGGAVEAGDWFGSALAAGDFDHDSFAHLAAGARATRSAAPSASCTARPVE